MILISVMYPQDSASAFDEGYYLNEHMPLVKARWSSMGLEDVHVVRGTGTLDGGAPLYHVMALLWFRSLEDFERAGKEHGAEIFADIPKFSSVTPLVQISEMLG
jgi:uncharacterized protein (TIGR02118 family)